MFFSFFFCYGVMELPVRLVRAIICRILETNGRHPAEVLLIMSLLKMLGLTAWIKPFRDTGRKSALTFGFGYFVAFSPRCGGCQAVRETAAVSS